MAVNENGGGPLRKLLGKVVGRVVDVALGTGRPPPPPTTGTDLGISETRPPEPTITDASETGTDLGNSESPVEVAAVGDASVRLSWALSDDALARARRVLGEDGELKARLVVVARDDERVVSSQIHDKGGVGAAGEWLVRHIPEGARCTAAVGLSRGERFVSAAHARVVVL